MCKNLHVNNDIAIIMLSLALYKPVPVIKEMSTIQVFPIITGHTKCLNKDDKIKKVKKHIENLLHGHEKRFEHAAQ